MFSKKILCFVRKYSSTATLLEGPPLGLGGGRVELDPRLMLTNLTNFKGLTLAQTKAAHTLLFKTHLCSNLHAANNLITSYSDCGRMDYAFRLFDEIPLRNLVSWNMMILGCHKNSLYNSSLRLFCQIHSMGVDMDEFTYGGCLSACVSLANAAIGMQVYGLVWKSGFLPSGYVRACMIDLFAKCGKVGDALRVLYDVEDHMNVVCWNSVVSGAVKNKDHYVALEVFAEMCRYDTLSPTSFTFSSVLTACAAAEELELGKCIHGRVVKSGAGSDVFVGTSIVDLYAKSGVMFDAVKQFELMTTRNVVSWTVIISAFAKKGDSVSAFSVFDEMRKSGEEINNFTVSSVLSACANPGMCEEALQIHCWSFKVGLYLDPVVKSSLINTYSKVGAVDLSAEVFVESGEMKQVGVWANMISAFVQSGIYEKAITFFQEMLQKGINPDMYIVSSILSVIDSLNLGRQVHGYAAKVGMVSEISVGSSILMMYSKCGNLEDSLKAFEQLERKDNVSWTSMIVGFAENGCADKAIQLFQEMGFEEYIPDDRILAAVLNSCSALRTLKLGRIIHGFALRCRFGEQANIDTALVNMYSKCGDLSSARVVFDRMRVKDQASWSFLISGFSRSGQVEKTLQLFHDLLMSDVNADAFTVSSILGALANSSELDVGEQLHAYITKVGFEAEASVVGSSLIMMYSKSGSITECCKVFQQITDPDLVCWTTMIASYANNGKGSEALQLFDRMKRSGIKPDAVTFLGVISACSHAGLVDEGYLHLRSMIRDYGIEPGQKHYASMVDLLGRAGRLEEAKRFIDSMPAKPGTFVWETLLAACKMHGDHELGKVAAEKVLESQPSDVGAYVSVSNIYAEAGEWDHVLRIREAIEETGARRKKAGWSYV